MNGMAHLSVRPGSAAKDDGLRLLQFLDSQLPWLSTLGSGGQWGSDSRSTTKNLGEMRNKIEASEKGVSEPWAPSSTRTWVVEATVPRSQLSTVAASLLDDDAIEDKNEMIQLPVAAVVIDGKAVDYVQEVLPTQDDKAPFVYVKYLATDRRAEEWSKGAGTYALRYAIDRVRDLGFKRICLDCWSGNGGRLVGYYEKQGFSKVGDFVAGEKKWAGTVLEMRL